MVSGPTCSVMPPVMWIVESPWLTATIFEESSAIDFVIISRFMIWATTGQQPLTGRLRPVRFNRKRNSEESNKAWVATPHKLHNRYSEAPHQPGCHHF